MLIRIPFLGKNRSGLSVLRRPKIASIMGCGLLPPLVWRPIHRWLDTITCWASSRPVLLFTTTGSFWKNLGYKASAGAWRVVNFCCSLRKIPTRLSLGPRWWNSCQGGRDVTTVYLSSFIHFPNKVLRVSKPEHPIPESIYSAVLDLKHPWRQRKSWRIWINRSNGVGMPYVNVHS